MMRRMKRLVGQGEEGQSLVLLAFAMIGLLGATAMSVDVGRAYWAKTQMQAAVDAAALAGAAGLPNTTTAGTQADQYWELNNDPLQSQGTNLVLTKSYTSGTTNKITATGQADVQTWFARVVGLNSWHITATATAGLTVMTGFAFDNVDIFPYAVWGGNTSYPNCTKPYGICAEASKTYRSNHWDNQVDQAQRNSGNWTVNGNNFKGYFNVGQADKVYQADPYQQYSFGGNATGQQPIDALHEHYVSGKPIILPVITKGTCSTSNCGTLDFKIVGWVALKLTVDPGSSNGDFKGDVVGDFMSTKGVGGGYQPGGGYPVISSISMTK